MLQKNHTLTVKDFQATMQKGRAYQNSSFLLKFLKNNEKTLRIGVGVSSKITRKAVKRNYHKRVLRALLKEIIQDFTVGYDIIFILQKGAEEKFFKELKKDVQELLKRIDLSR